MESYKLDKKLPICPQIEEQIKVLVSNGGLKHGEKLSSVRDVAITLAVNPNTVQKAFENLEREGILVSRRGSGWFVSDETESLSNLKDSLVKEKTDKYIKEMKSLGFSTDEIIKLIKECEI